MGAVWGGETEIFQGVPIGWAKPKYFGFAPSNLDRILTSGGAKPKHFNIAYHPQKRVGIAGLAMKSALRGSRNQTLN